MGHLLVPRSVKTYDKLSYRLFLKDLKFYLFGSSSYKMTKKRCEAFFDDDQPFCTAMALGQLGAARD